MGLLNILIQENLSSKKEYTTEITSDKYRVLVSPYSAEAWYERYYDYGMIDDLILVDHTEDGHRLYQCRYDTEMGYYISADGSCFFITIHRRYC